VNTPYQEALSSTLIDRTIREKIVLVSVALPGVDDEAVDASLDELELLVGTAGARRPITPRTSEKGRSRSC
jgi:GTPase